MLPHYPPHFFEELIAKLEDVAKVAFGNDFQAEEMLWWGSLDLSRHQARIWLLQKKTTARFLRQLLWTGEDLATKVR